VIAQADGDAQRFKSVLTEYQKAPAVTRDRLYLETMQQVYSNVTKVMVDTRSGSNLLYLPLDKIMQSSTVEAPAPLMQGPASAPQGSAPLPNVNDPRSRLNQRSRERDAR
jgi:membrane protease subunit HflK